MSLDARVNFAFGTVTTAPSPNGATGLSMVVSNAAGWPTPPFNATVHAAGATRAQIQSGGEIVRCTANASGTWTIARAAEGPNGARTIVIGDEVSFGVTARTLDDIAAIFLGAVIAPTASTTNKGLAITQSAHGTTAVTGYYGLNLFTITADDADSGTGSGYAQIFADYTWGGAAAKGNRIGVFGYVKQTAVSGNTQGYTIGLQGIAESSSGDGGTNTGAGAKGSLFGENPQARSNGATNMYSLVGGEDDIMGIAASTQKYVFGRSVVSFHINAGATMDAAFITYASGLFSGYGPGGGFGYGLCIAELESNGQTPIRSTGTLVGVSLTSLSTINVAKGIDFAKAVFSSNALDLNSAASSGANGFIVSSTGRLGIGMAPTGIGIEVKSATAFRPQFDQWNDNNGSSGPYVIFDKSRAGGPAQVNDTLGTLLFRGYDSNSAIQNGPILQANCTSVSAGAITGDLQIVSARLMLAAGIAGRAALNYVSGVAPTSPNAGDQWADGKCFYGSGAASQTGVMPTLQIATVANGAKTALNNASAAAQNIFASANDVLTVLGSTTYRFRARIRLNTGATTHTTAFGIALTTATLSSIIYDAASTSSAADTLSTPQMRRVSTNTAAVLTATSTAVTTDIVVDGILRTGTAGQITPQITFSGGPTGTCEVDVNSFFELWPIGADTAVAVGPWA